GPTPPRVATEAAAALHRTAACGGVRLREPLRPRACGGHGEEFRSDIHEAKQHRLTVFELRPEPHHGVEHAARQPPRPPLHVAEVRRQAPEPAVLRPEAPTQPARWIPPAVKETGA